MVKIKISEIFTSIDGEVNHWGQGGLTTFIRFAGCNLRCSYCDTEYAQKEDEAEVMSVTDILDRVEAPKVTITGGEPMMQENALMHVLIPALARREIKITIETNGSLPIWTPSWAGDLVGWVVDFKFEYAKQMQLNNFIMRGEQDWIKFVIDKEDDYREMMKQARFFRRCLTKGRMAVSTTQNISPKWVINKLIKDNQWDISLNVQLHKCINVK
jgi:7-carboxy-7-deazaguanine synthase